VEITHGLSKVGGVLVGVEALVQHLVEIVQFFVAYELLFSINGRRQSAPALLGGACREISMTTACTSREWPIILFWR
jgi:hypothetical protein